MYNHLIYKYILMIVLVALKNSEDIVFKMPKNLKSNPEFQFRK